jgi:hypothetical protein
MPMHAFVHRHKSASIGVFGANRAERKAAGGCTDASAALVGAKAAQCTFTMRRGASVGHPSCLPGRYS